MTTESEPLRTVEHEIEDFLERATELRGTAEQAVDRLRVAHVAAKLRAEMAKKALDGAQHDLDRIEDIVDACVGEKRVHPTDAQPRKRAREDLPSRYWSPAEVERLSECAKNVDPDQPPLDFYTEIQKAFGPSRTVCAIRYKASTLGIKPNDEV